MNLFIIESPLQYLNALEARFHFEIPASESFLIILNQSGDENLKQIDYMINDNDWCEIKIISDNGSGFTNILNRIRTLNKIIHENKYEINSVFIGEYRNQFMRHIANKLPSNVYLLDDGAAVINVYNKLINNESFEGNNIKTLIKRNIFGLKSKNIKKITFFTAYDFPEKENIKIVKNNYISLKNRMTNSNSKDIIFFLGQPLSEKKIMKETDNLKCLKKIREFYGDKVIYYIKHRGESEEKMVKVEELGFIVKRFSTCIEYEMCYGDQIPTSVSSFYSSALISINNIFKDLITINSFYIPNLLITDDYKKGVENIYDYFQNQINVSLKKL